MSVLEPERVPQAVRDSVSSELESMRQIAKALGMLEDDDARQRVLRWAQERFGVSGAPLVAADDARLDVAAEFRRFALEWQSV